MNSALALPKLGFAGIKFCKGRKFARPGLLRRRSFAKSGTLKARDETPKLGFAGLKKRFAGR